MFAAKVLVSGIHEPRTKKKEKRKPVNFCDRWYHSSTDEEN